MGGLDLGKGTNYECIERSKSPIAWQNKREKEQTRAVGVLEDHAILLSILWHLFLLYFYRMM
jgi:hypothetical protein